MGTRFSALLPTWLKHEVPHVEHGENHAELPKPTDEKREATANPGYALGQLARALTASESHPDAAVRARNVERVETWRCVFAGMLSGSLQVGSRVPVKGAPAWVTLKVTSGGFVTGELLAGGPLQLHERRLLARLSTPAPPDGEHATLNAHFLSDAGLAELQEMLTTGRYRITVPEEGALLAVAWLVSRNYADRAREVLDDIGSHLGHLRFYPVPHERSMETAASAHLQDVGTTIEQLQAVRLTVHMGRQREVIRVWLPLYDRIVALFAETVIGQLPALLPPRRVGGLPVVVGGWPCQLYPDGWTERAGALLDDYKHLRAEHQLCQRPDTYKRGGLAQLRRYLERCICDPKSLSGHDVGRIREILAGFVTRRGAPGSARAEALRSQQAQQVALPCAEDLARLLVARLTGLPNDEGLPSLEAVLAVVSEVESEQFKIPAGWDFPSSLVDKVRRSLDAPLSVLVEQGIVPSVEVLALLVPQITAGVLATGILDAELRRLYVATYTAFRNRRSVLLLNLQSQVKLEELPWVNAINDFRSDASTRELARLTLEELVITALVEFPQQILPNRLLREIRALLKDADMDVPVVEELAADIFMFVFHEKFVRAAQISARLLEGKLYECYYGVSFAQVRDISDLDSSGYGPPTSETFNAMCQNLAGPTPGGYSVAHSGAIVEQQQILTTHNLAPLFDALGLTERLQSELEAMALRCFDWICKRVQQLEGPWKTRLQAVKNAAYAWRQMVFFLTVAPEGTEKEFFEKARLQLEKEPAEVRLRLAPAMAGLVRASQGLPVEAPVSLEEPAGARRFLGWSKSHWLLVPLHYVGAVEQE